MFPVRTLRVYRSLHFCVLLLHGLWQIRVEIIKFDSKHFIHSVISPAWLKFFVTIKSLILSKTWVNRKCEQVTSKNIKEMTETAGCLDSHLRSLCNVRASNFGYWSRITDRTFFRSKNIWKIVLHCLCKVWHSLFFVSCLSGLDPVFTVNNWGNWGNISCPTCQFCQEENNLYIESPQCLVSSWK